MKKIVMTCLMAFAVTATAQTTVPVVWPFSLASTQGAMVREIVQEANTIQKKYQFVLDHKPGAGGAVAVQHTLSQRTPVVLAHTNSYFIRPHVSQEGSYDTDLLQVVSAYCENQPLALIAKNFSTLADLDRKPNLTVGVIAGSITQLVSQELARQRPRLQLTEVGFKGTPEITLSMLGDHIDISIDFLASVSDDRIRVLGITGTIAVGAHKTMRSQGLQNFDNITNSYYLLINRQTDPALAAELSGIMTRASQGVRVQEFCRKDHGQPADITGQAAQRLATARRDFWANQIKAGQKK
jgi:tripartite-type tricarboxylate transporter receptor subunit TctC